MLPGLLEVLPGGLSAGAVLIVLPSLIVQPYMAPSLPD